MQPTAFVASSSRQTCHGGSSLSDCTVSGDRAAGPCSEMVDCVETLCRWTLSLTIAAHDTA